MPRGASVAAVLFTGNDGAGASLTGYNGLLIPRRLILVAVGCGHGRRYTLCDDPRPGFDAFAYWYLFQGCGLGPIALPNGYDITV